MTGTYAEAADHALATRLLDRGLVEQAYPLVSARVPGITLDRWTRFALAHAAPRAGDLPKGLMAVLNSCGYILGMFAFELRDDLREGRVLCVDNVIVPDLPGRDLIWAAAIDAIDQLAAMHGGRAVFTELPCDGGAVEDDTAWAAPLLRRHGYSRVGGRAFKRLHVSQSRGAGAAAAH